MNKRNAKLIENLRKYYEPLADILPERLMNIDTLAAQLEAVEDDMTRAFRENPKTLVLFEAAVQTYKTASRKLMNDDGTLDAVERARLSVSKMWAAWFMRALGRDPDVARKEIEGEIMSLAQSTGLLMRTVKPKPPMPSTKKFSRLTNQELPPTHAPMSTGKPIGSVNKYKTGYPHLPRAKRS